MHVQKRFEGRLSRQCACVSVSPLHLTLIQRHAFVGVGAVKQADAFDRVNTSASASVNSLSPAWDVLGILQHHDAMTGTFVTVKHTHTMHPWGQYRCMWHGERRGVGLLIATHGVNAHACGMESVGV